MNDVRIALDFEQCSDIIVQTLTDDLKTLIKAYRNDDFLDDDEIALLRAYVKLLEHHMLWKDFIDFLNEYMPHKLYTYFDKTTVENILRDSND